VAGVAVGRPCLATVKMFRLIVEHVSLGFLCYT
jgi:hypothetical protein